MYGLHPWDIDRLAPDDFERYAAGVETWMRMHMSALGAVGEVA